MTVYNRDYIYPLPPQSKGDMRKEDYDVNEDRRIDYAERLANEDRTIQIDAEQLHSHLENRSIHIEIDDDHIRSDATFSGHKITDLIDSRAPAEHRHYAVEVDVNTSDFDNLLGSDDNTVQKALNTLDKSVQLNTTLKCGIVNVKGGN